MSSYDCMDLCRLCLVKDRVSVPIFEGEGDVRQIFLKIAACLPVKVGREDKLPKKICDDCVYKVELLYEFWNTTANAEKQLLQWLGEDGEDKQGYVSNVMESELMKQETVENRLESSVMQQEDHQNNMNLNMMDQMGLTMPIIMTTDQQQITSVPMTSSGNNIQAVPGTSSQSPRGRKSGNNEDDEEESEDEDNSDDDCDNDGGINVKEETPETGRNVEPSFVNVTIPCDEAGPSGLQQQKLSEMPEMVMGPSSEGDPKSGHGMMETIAHSSPAAYRVVVVCKPSGEKTTSLILGDKEIARNIPLMLPTKDPLCTREQMLRATVECPICHRKFADRAAVNKHTSSAHKSAYKCKHCDTCFFTQTGLDQHMATHKHPLVFPCHQCKKKYKRRDGLNLHIVRAHSKIEAKFTCDDCDKPFQLKADLLVHMSRAHMLQECRFCHKIVKDLKNHEDAHKKKNADIIDENCDLCGQRFRSKARYDSHRKKHKDGRNLECKECGLVFPGHRALINHRDRAHRSGTTCEICKKVFYSITNYYQHVLVHAGIKPYKCDVCSENFSQRTSLKRHRERHEGPLPPFDEVTRIAHLAKEYLDTL